MSATRAFAVHLTVVDATIGEHFRRVKMKNPHLGRGRGCAPNDKRSGAEPRAGNPTYCDKKESPLNYTERSVQVSAVPSSGLLKCEKKYQLSSFEGDRHVNIARGSPRPWP